MAFTMGQNPTDEGVQFTAEDVAEKKMNLEKRIAEPARTTRGLGEDLDVVTTIQKEILLVDDEDGGTCKTVHREDRITDFRASAQGRVIPHMVTTRIGSWIALM